MLDYVSNTINDKICAAEKASGSVSQCMENLWYCFHKKGVKHLDKNQLIKVL